MLINNAISIISNARLALGDLALAISENIQNGLNSTDDQKDLRRRLVLTYGLLKTLDKILVLNADGTINYILGLYDNVKINRMLLFLKDISKSGNLPVVSKMLNPVVTNVGQGSGPQGPPGPSGASAYVYIGYADDSSGTGYSTSPAGKTYVAFKTSPTVISPVNASTFTGLWKLFVCADGADGADGNDGASAYLYIGYADAADGSGFTLTFNSSKDYIAVLQSASPTPPVQADFTGLWKNYKGQPGADGLDGSDGDSAFVYIAYADAADGTGFTNTFDSSKDYIAILPSIVEIPSPVQADFAGLWKNYKGAPGTDGTDGADGVGTPGVNAYEYIAYADSITGTGYILAQSNDPTAVLTPFDPLKKFIAILASDISLGATITVTNFAGLWAKYAGDGDRWSTSSLTSLTIGTGLQTLVVDLALAYVTGQRVVIATDNDPSNRMEGYCVNYNPANGQLQVNVDTATGSGTFNVWDVSLQTSLPYTNIVILDTNITTVGNVGTGEDTIYTFSMSAGLLSTNKQGLQGKSVGTLIGASASPTRRVRLKLDGTVILDTGNFDLYDGEDMSYSFDYHIIREDATHVRCHAIFDSSSLKFNKYVRLTKTLSLALDLTITGEATNNDDITHEMTKLYLEGN